MTMQNLPHPDDELLAAYAGGDPDALADASLLAHLSACDRCRPLVDELSLLRGALAELPDIAPSRPLRLIPPVPAAVAAPTARRPWLRRLTAPAMAAGAALVLVGAVGIGVSGPASGFFGQAASARSNKETAATDQAGVPAAAGSPPTLVPGDTKGGADYQSTPEPRPASSAQAPAPKPTASEGRFTGDLGNRPATGQPWLTLLLAGAGLLAISAALRFSLSPRAG
jgi:hypothetical protein